MAGATLEFESETALAVIRKVIAATQDPRPMFNDMGEYLLLAHRLRFDAQQTPEGVAWAPLSPKYQKQKKKNKNKILFLDGYLANTLRYQSDISELLFGSNRPYAALMHFGGVVDRKSRKQDIYSKQNRDGSVGNKFVKKKKSNFAQTVDVKAHKVTYPARQFLGTSNAENNRLVEIALKHLRKPI